jgi:L-ascorbate metabolism protein UlaG (beta-lactamase superfamily)
MNNTGLYLKQNVLIEPLFNQWYAWPGLIYPATAAMYIANSHSKIMQSFVSAPNVHLAALKNPKLLGGPFVGYDESKVSHIRELLERTQREQSHMLEFAKAIKDLDETLTREAGGFGLAPMYHKVPGSLRGYVELVYDLNNNPSARFIEGLLYKSPYYNQNLQSVELSTINNDDRPFAFSTPRLKSDDRLQLNIPFCDSRLDDLFRMRRAPRPLGQIEESLGIGDDSKKLFSTFFAKDMAQSGHPYTGSGVRIRYMGHACLLIESSKTRMLVDPVISYRHGNGIPRFTYADLPETIDYVLITHSHQDHCMLETLLQLRHQVSSVIVPKNNSGALTDPSLKLVLQNIGFRSVIEIDEIESIKVDGGEIISLPFLGEHADLNIRTKTAYFISLAGQSVICAADSNNIEPAVYDHIHDLVHDPDAIFLGMECDGAPLTWIYGSILTRPLTRKQDQSRRLDGSDYEKAIDIVRRLKPRRVYVYAMGQEPWLRHVTSIEYTEDSRPIIESNKLVEDCKNRGIVSERLFGQKEIFLN